METQKTFPISSSLSVAPGGRTICIRPKTILSIQLAAIFILLILNLLGIYLSLFTEVAFAKTHRLVDFNQEANIPTFYSSLVMVLCSLLLFVITALTKKAGTGYWCWLWLGMIFLFLSFDEAAAIHEIFIGITKRTFNLSGYFNYAWVVPYGLGVLVLAGLYIPFLRSLPRHTLLLFLVSGVVFVAGAIGLEMIGGNAHESQGAAGLYAVIYTLEELLEMLGMALFLYALLDYLSENFDFNVRVGK